MPGCSSTPSWSTDARRIRDLLTVRSTHVTVSSFMNTMDVHGTYETMQHFTRHSQFLVETSQLCGTGVWTCSVTATAGGAGGGLRPAAALTTMVTRAGASRRSLFPSSSQRNEWGSFSDAPQPQQKPCLVRLSCVFVGCGSTTGSDIRWRARRAARRPGASVSDRGAAACGHGRKSGLPRVVLPPACRAGSATWTIGG